MVAALSALRFLPISILSRCRSTDALGAVKARCAERPAGQPRQQARVRPWRRRAHHHLARELHAGCHEPELKAAALVIATLLAHALSLSLYPRRDPVGRMGD
jgi:hypothetical protein